MGYCVSCGKLSDTHNGLCPQCSEDFSVNSRSVAMMEDREVDTAYLEHAARSCRTAMSAAMLAALARGYSCGFRFGW